MFRKTTILAIAGFSLAITSYAGNGFADTQPVAGIADRRPELPPLNSQLQPQAAQYTSEPTVNDYQGSNTPLPPISTVTFNGPTVIDADTLIRITKPYLDRPITDNDIAELKNKITAAYASKGYPLVKVATPSQDLNDGELTVNIYEGRVGRVVAGSNNVIPDYVTQGFGNRLTNNIFDESEADGVISDLKEINNTQTSLTLKPGMEPLTTDVYLNVLPGGNEDNNYVAVDNYGSDLTGEYVGSIHLEKTNALRLGEKLSFDGRISDENLYAAGGGISIPTGLLNTFFDASYLYSKNDIVDRLEFLNAKGETQILNIGMHANVISEADNKLTLRGGVDIREHRSYLFDTIDSKDHIRRGYIGATYLGIAPEISTVVLADAKLSRGLDILSASQEGSPNLSRSAANPEAWMLEPSLYLRHDLTPSDTVSIFTRGQLATDVLLSSDLFILGGYGSVRGFPVAQEVGEAGFTATGEYQHKFGLTDNVSLAVGPWVDGGHVYNRLSKQTVDNTLISAGLGAEFVADIVPVGETSLRLDWAHPLGDYDSAEVDDNSFYFRVQQNF